MARIVVAQESVAGPNQIYDAFLIGAAFAARGHEVTYIVDDLAGLHAAAGPGAAIDGWQCPVPTPLPSDSPKALLSYAEKMARSGYRDAATLRWLARAWDGQLRRLTPDAIVGLSSPVAWLVGPQLAPTFVVGSGFALPAPFEGSFAHVPGEMPSSCSMDSMLANANRVLGELGISSVGSMSEVLERCGQCRYGPDSLDPYLAYRRGPSLGGLASTRPAGDQTTGSLAAFIDARCSNAEGLALAIGGLSPFAVDLFIRDAPVAMRNYLVRQPNIRLRDSLDTALAEAKRADAIVHHGAPVFASFGLALGRPQLVLPWTAEQWACADGLNRLGVNWVKDPNSSIPVLHGTLRGLLSDAGLAGRARNHGSGADGALAAVVGSVEAAIAGRPTAPRAFWPDSEVAASAAATESADPSPSKTFCALPFQHLCIGTEGTARICCVAQDFIKKDGVPMSLYVNTADEIWNSDHLREVRRAMVAGEPLKVCEVCYANERATGQSYRTEIGLMPLPRQRLDQSTLRQLESSGYRVEGRPGFIKLELGNLCNLKCRMCSGVASSEIERDPVHSRWNGGAEPLHAVWRDDVAMVGPDIRIGVSRQGVYDFEEDENGRYCWTDGRAAFDIPVGAASKLMALELEFRAEFAPGRSCDVRVDGRLLAQARIDPANPLLRVDISEVVAGKSVRVEIESETWIRKGDGRRLGVPLVAVKLKRRTLPSDWSGDGAEILDLRLVAPGLWYENDGLLFDDLLGDLSRLQRIFVTGGEPLLEPRFLRVVDYLIDNGAADNIDLEIVTNATRISEEKIAKLSRFKKLDIMLSLDGVAGVYDYMRYPARWENVQRNVRLLRRLVPGAVVAAIPVVQTYNVLGLVDIARFCSEVGIGFGANFIQTPERLRVENLPEAIRRVAGGRLRAYAEADCPDAFRDHVLSMASYLESSFAPPNPDLLREFMVFTNDLDATRGQSIHQSVPELIALLEANGHPWIGDTWLSGRGEARRSARERVHAWV